MISKFRPDKYYPSIFDINFDLLKEQGIKLIACDLDNTLVPHDILDATQEVISLVNHINDLGMAMVVLSNNKYKRVKRFCEKLDIKFYYSSKKPLRKNFLRILNDYKLDPSEMCLIGDQIMTDVFGANRMNIMSIFVEPLAHRDIIYTKVNRQLEKRMIRKLEKRGLFKQGEYYE